MYHEKKEQLKEWAEQIKLTKPLFKQAQRDHDWTLQSTFRSRLWHLKTHYRHLHIAMSLLRGTPYERIEQPREDNKPDWDLVQKYLTELRQAQEEEAVPAE